MAPKPQDPISRFWNSVDKTDTCWFWTKRIDHRGYGRFRGWPRKQWKAHAYAWIITNGEIPNGLFVLHSCDNKRCVRPDHLHLGTHDDNMREGIERNRFKRGSDASWSRLTEEAVADIRTSSLTQWALAHKYGVTQSAVWRALRGHDWKHVTQPPRSNVLHKQN